MAEVTDLGAAYCYAPHALSSRWGQHALLETYNRWEATRPHDLDAIIEVSKTEDSPFLWLDIENHSTGPVGPNGQPQDFTLDYGIDEPLLEGELEGLDEGPLLHDFASDLIEGYKQAILDDKPEMLSVQEYLVYVAYQGASEAQVADAFGITIGTVRGKIGRVREKIQKATELTSFNNSLEHFSDIGRKSFEITQDVLTQVSEDELPVQSKTTIGPISDKYTSYAHSESEEEPSS